MRPLVLVLALFVSGCGLSPQGDAVRMAVMDQGAQASDAGRDNAVWYLCNAASVGSIRRWLGGDPVKMQAWNNLCLDSAALPLTLPE